MNISPEGIELIKHFESLRLVPYQDSVGVWTAGWGHTEGVTEDTTCNMQQADAWLLDDLKTAEDAVNKLVTIPLTQAQFDALVSFTYNLGAKTLKLSTLLKLVNEGRYADAEPQFDRWVNAGGKQLLGLVRRRKAERLMFGGHPWQETNELHSA